ncbi:MAG: cation transporter [Actinomycetota bacterium]
MQPNARFPRLDSRTAVGVAADRLAELESRHGQVGAMVATMANSPTVVAGYLDLSRAVKRTKLPRTVTERISLAVQEHLGCQLCLQAHTDAARSAGLDEDEIALARAGTSADPDIAPIVRFGRQVLVGPSWITDADVDELRGLGLRDRDVLDIVALVSLNVLTGTFNLVAGLEPDHPLNPPTKETTPMSTNTFTVTGMTCGHCVASVTEELQEVPGVEDVAVTLETGEVVVTSVEPLTREAVEGAVGEAGYQLA